MRLPGLLDSHIVAVGPGFTTAPVSLSGLPNNSMEPPPLRFAKHPEGRGSSTDPGQPACRFLCDTGLGWPGGSPQGAPQISRPFGSLLVLPVREG